MTLNEQSRLIQSLLCPAHDRQHIETHISHLLLSGDYAYKLKKPLHFDFLDYSTLEKRHQACQEELRLNRRLAPQWYLEVIAITGTIEQPRLQGQGQPIDYALKMRRFPPNCLLSEHPELLNRQLIKTLANTIAHFHQQIATLHNSSSLGTPTAILTFMLQNFTQLDPIIQDATHHAQLKTLKDWTQQRFVQLEPVLAMRRAQGWIRECHGDLHLGNIALVNEQLLIFDGIEFNPALRWIDTLNEIAFLLMDLRHFKRADLAQCLLDHYLQCTGDFSGLSLLCFYQVYRAMVRAKIAAIRLTQTADAAQKERWLAECHSYLALATACTQAKTPRLIVLHGLSGSGKSTVAQDLVEFLPALALHSDVERKRLFGLAPEARTTDRTDIYTKEASKRTYQRLVELARICLQAGKSVVIDATCLLQEQRRPFFALAQELTLPLVILDCQLPQSELQKRLNQRQQLNQDPSEATFEVVQQQLDYREPLSSQERRYCLTIDTTQAVDGKTLAKACRSVLILNNA